MEKFINFIDILVWIFAIVSTGYVVLRLIAYCMYDDLDRLRDKLNGVHAQYPIIYGSIVAIISWVCIFATYIGKLL